MSDGTGPNGSRIGGTRRGSPPSLLLMLFGDYWLEVDAGLPSAALVTLLGDFGVQDAAARAALSRSVKRGLLRSEKVGRNTYYRGTARLHDILTDASRRIVGGASADVGWSGEWSLVAFDIPENGRSLRVAARTRLGWLGFAPLYDEVWICPHDRTAAALRQLTALGIEATSFRARLGAEGGARPPQAAWDLAELAGRYEAFTRDAAAAESGLREGRMPPARALVHRIQLLEGWLELAGRDPELPASLLPADWPRDRARERFLAVHEALGDLATERVRAVVGATDPHLARLVERRTAADWPRLVG